MGLLKEFGEFAKRGNVMDLAVGVIIGGAFGKIVSSMVNDIVMPPIGLAMGNADFTQLYMFLGDKAKVPAEGFADIAAAKAAGPVLAWGNFVQSSIDFLIIAFVIFMMIKGLNKFSRKDEAKAAA
jgi:large conductance mechanosensitive channel